MKRNKVTATPQELNAYNRFIMVEQRFETLVARIETWALTLPALSASVVLRALTTIEAGDPPTYSLPAEMPRCDAEDVRKRLDPVLDAAKAMRRFQAAAGSLVS